MAIPTRLLLLAMLIACFAVQVLQGINPDVSWLITVSERMLSGQTLYVDIFEINPPMSALLYLPSVWLGHVIGIEPEHVVLASVIGFAALTMWIASRVLLDAGLLRHPTAWWLVTFGVMTLLPGSNFGEREHIAVLALLPILATGAARVMGRAPTLLSRVAAGFGGGLAMTIKPHFAFAILLPALYGAWKARSLKSLVTLEHVIAGLILVGFWIAVWLWFPAFFTRMLPISQLAYVGTNASFLSLLTNTDALSIWLILAGLLILYRREALTPPIVQYLAAALGFYVAYLAQGKGFIYHLLPVMELVTLSFATAFLARNPPGHTVRTAILPIAAMVGLAIAPAVPAMAGNPLRREVHDLLAPMGPGITVANLTPQLEVASPLVRSLHGTLVNSGACLWIALGALRQQMTSSDPETLKRAKALETFERDLLRDNLLANPPDVILAGSDVFDWLAWARVDPKIDALLDSYTLIKTVGPSRAPLLVLKHNLATAS